ncbi:MAG TPA: NnrS family protein, partial [Luteimonas sp.]|nr:NnrS family protein [Luteimonas sp.]
LALELVHGYQWLWAADAPLLAIAGTWLWRNWPRAGGDGGMRGNPPQRALLNVLFLGYSWLPVAFALYSAQSAIYALHGDFLLGRAPAHAMFIGFFGSLLVAMVTRVTQGHSGRPLELGRAATFAFVALQLVALARIVAELAPDPMAWQAAAAAGWLLAFAPWVLRSLRIYATPRIDGRPG